VQQTFSEAVRHHQQSVENEWESEKEKILNSLLGSSQDIEFPSESEVNERERKGEREREKIYVMKWLYDPR
jgi:hypothetical protein